MATLQEHRTVKRVREELRHKNAPDVLAPLDADWLRQTCLAAGADDVGFVEIDRAELAHERQDILTLYPFTKSLIGFDCRMNREPIRSPARSVANVEFHRTGDHTNDVARAIVTALERRGVRAVNPAMGFPMEMDRFPGKIWVVSHKLVAVAAGLGQMGIHRNVIHPKFGNFVLLGTILTDVEISRYDHPIDYNPCLECKLCVAACPTGAIGSDGRFDFSACYTHNYREFMGGFSDWVEKIADSPNAKSYRDKVSDSETVSMWQSLSFGANYKAAYCLSVCPAGEEVIGPFQDNRKQFLDDVVRPLQQKEETIYVVKDSDAERYVQRRFPHKETKRVQNNLRPNSIAGFLRGITLTFQRGKAEGLDAVYHFTFTGKESAKATVVIRDKKLEVQEGHVGTAALHLTADSETWLRVLAKEANLLWALLRGKIRMKGSPRLMLAFSKCFLE